MKIICIKLSFHFMLTVLIFFVCCRVNAQVKEDVLFLNFENDNFSNTKLLYDKGINGQGLDLENSESTLGLIKEVSTDWFSNSKDFSISIWVKSKKSTLDTTLILSNTDFRKKAMGIYNKRRINKGFALYSCNGTWGWNIGNGSAHYNYEPVINDQPIADNKWHQLVFTYNATYKEVRLYYDGINKAVLSIGDLKNKDFSSDLPLIIGKNDHIIAYKSFPGIVDELQILNIALTQDQVKEAFKKYAKLKKEPELKGDTFTILNWNIWHGGSHFLKKRDGFDGVARIIKMIKKSESDIILMQETYGAGSKISSSLGYYYYEASSTIGAVWGANISVMSRFPIQDVYMLEEPSNYGKNYAFNSGGAKIKLSNKREVIVFSNWYNGNKPEDLEGALTGWKQLVDNTDKTPIIWAGDFNSVSHLDDGIGESGHSKLMTNAGFTDSFRELFPDAKKYPCFTAPRNKDKIDFIYYKGHTLKLIHAGKIIENFKGKNTPGYPSDHLGLTSKFKLN